MPASCRSRWQRVASAADGPTSTWLLPERSSGCCCCAGDGTCCRPRATTGGWTMGDATALSSVGVVCITATALLVCCSGRRACGSLALRQRTKSVTTNHISLKLLYYNISADLEDHPAPRRSGFDKITHRRFGASFVRYTIRLANHSISSM